MKNIQLINLITIALFSFSTFSHSSEENSESKEAEIDVTASTETQQPGYFHRIDKEAEEEFNPYVLTPHKMTYILPVSYSNDMNDDVYLGRGPWNDGMQSTEMKFQVSIKVPLTEGDIFTEGDGFDFAFTLQSWWQLYNQDLSRPFRETNYQPEFFYTAPLSWQPYGGQTNMVIGFEHQSNGRTQLLSRSWNRLYYTFTFAKDDYAISLRPWWKIPEGDKETTLFESANDNVDISDYMGTFDLTVLYRWDTLEFSFLGRRNFQEDHGFMEIGMTFPLTGKLKGYLQMTSGYGESLIDYNHSQETIGVGIALTEMF